MVNQVKPFALTIPPGTPAAAPMVFNTDLGNYDVVAVSVIVPDGPNGCVGFRFTSGGQAMVPASATDWIVASGESLEWPLTGGIDTGAWQVTAYNTGSYPHTIYVRYLLDIAGQPNQATSQVNLLSTDSIMGGTDLAATSVPDVTP